MAHEALFRPKPRDLIWEAFLNDQQRYFTRELNGLIETFFYRFFIEFICGFFPVVEKTDGLWRTKVIQSLVTGYPLLDEDSVSQWIPALMATERPQKLREEMAVFLKIIRASYCAIIRGPKESCWEHAAPVIERESHVCPSYDRCWNGSPEAKEIAGMTRCVKYTVSWSGTELAIRSWESACDSPRTLAQLIRQKCPLLELVTDPAGLLLYLQEHYFPGRDGDGSNRTSRGAIVRVLSALGDHCLEDLNSRLALTGESKLAFLQPPAPDGCRGGGHSV